MSSQDPLRNIDRVPSPELPSWLRLKYPFALHKAEKYKHPGQRYYLYCLYHTRALRATPVLLLLYSSFVSVIGNAKLTAIVGMGVKIEGRDDSTTGVDGQPGAARLLHLPTRRPVQRQQQRPPRAASLRMNHPPLPAGPKIKRCP